MQILGGVDAIPTFGKVCRTTRFSICWAIGIKKGHAFPRGLFASVSLTLMGSSFVGVEGVEQLVLTQSVEPFGATSKTSPT
jgi:hypothetical protein